MNTIKKRRRRLPMIFSLSAYLLSSLFICWLIRNNLENNMEHSIDKIKDTVEYNSIVAGGNASAMLETSELQLMRIKDKIEIDPEISKTRISLYTEQLLATNSSICEVILINNQGAIQWQKNNEAVSSETVEMLFNEHNHKKHQASISEIRNPSEEKIILSYSIYNKNYQLQFILAGLVDISTILDFDKQQVLYRFSNLSFLNNQYRILIQTGSSEKNIYPWDYYSSIKENEESIQNNIYGGLNTYKLENRIISIYQIMSYPFFIATEMDLKSILDTERKEIQRISLLLGIMLLVGFIFLFNIMLLKMKQKDNEIRFKDQLTEKNQKLLFTNKQLIETTSNLETTLNSIGDCVIILDSEFHVIYMNPVAERISGFTQDEVKHSHFQDIFSIWDPQCLDCNPLDFKDKNLEKYPYLIWRNRVGRELKITSTLTPIASGNEHYGFVLILHDASAEYQLHEKMRLENKVEAIGRISGGISHEINNIISGILTSSELLQMSPTLSSDKEALRYVKMIIELVERAATLTSQLQSYTPHSPHNFQKIDLEELINHEIQQWTSLSPKEIGFIVTSSLEKTVIEGNPESLKNVINQLARNSIQAIAKKGAIEFHIDKKTITEGELNYPLSSLTMGDYVQLRVKDNGIGIPRKFQEHIFDPFFTTRKLGEANGLGLSTVYGIIKEHGGIIHADSSDEQGTVITLYLPLSQS